MARRLAILLLCLSVWVPCFAGHDQPEEDLVYFLPIAPDRVKRLLDVGEKMVFIDIRARAEFAQQRLPSARSIPLNELERRHAEVPKTGRVVLYCACPEGRIEEGFSYQLLRDLGYRNVSVLEGGIAAWRARGYPLEGGATN